MQNQEDSCMELDYKKMKKIAADQIGNLSVRNMEQAVVISQLHEKITALESEIKKLKSGKIEKNK